VGTVGESSRGTADEEESSPFASPIQVDVERATPPVLTLATASVELTLLQKQVALLHTQVALLQLQVAALEARGALVERAVLPVLRLISEEQDPLRGAGRRPLPGGVC